METLELISKVRVVILVLVKLLINGEMQVLMT